MRTIPDTIDLIKLKLKPFRPIAILDLYYSIIESIGSVFTGYVFYKSGTRNGIENTIDSLIAQGFLRHKKDKDGEVEIIKWNDHTKQEG